MFILGNVLSKIRIKSLNGFLIRICSIPFDLLSNFAFHHFDFNFPNIIAKYIFSLLESLQNLMTALIQFKRKLFDVTITFV